MSGRSQAHCRLSRFSSLSSSRSTFRAELNSSLDFRPCEVNFAALPATTIVYRLSGARPGAATLAEESVFVCERPFCNSQFRNFGDMIICGFLLWA